MSGIIWTYQRCPRCGGRYPTSRGGYPIVCDKCKTQPTKFIIKIPFQKRRLAISHDRDGRTVHDFNRANNLLGQIRSEIQTGIFDPEIYKQQSATKLDRFWGYFESKYEKSPGTYAKLSTIREHHLGCLGKHQMRDVRAYHLNEWWRWLREKELSPHYLNDIHQWVKRFFNEAYELDIIEKVPHFPKRIVDPVQHIEWLTAEEQESVLDHLPKYDRPIYEFLFITGCRVGEAIALQQGDIDLQKGKTVISKTIRRDGTFGPTKAKKPRLIPHCDDLLACYVAARKISGLKGFVFTNCWGRHYSDDYLRDRLGKACDAAGIPRIPLKNATRHSWGMQRIQDGYDIFTVSQGYGHSDIKMTQNYVEMLTAQTAKLYGLRQKREKRKSDKVVNIGNNTGKSV